MAGIENNAINTIDKTDFFIFFYLINTYTLNDFEFFEIITKMMQISFNVKNI
jgi:hypothetical protein